MSSAKTARGSAGEREADSDPRRYFGLVTCHKTKDDGHERYAYRLPYEATCGLQAAKPCRVSGLVLASEADVQLRPGFLLGADTKRNNRRVHYGNGGGG
jgi:hypothetical protein